MSFDSSKTKSTLFVYMEDIMDFKCRVVFSWEKKHAIESFNGGNEEEDKLWQNEILPTWVTIKRSGKVSTRS